MSSKHRCVAIMSLAVVLGACTTTGAGASDSVPPASPVAVATLTATAIVPTATPATSSTGPSASPGGGGGASAAPPSIDPCSLLTQAEASTLMGKALGAGVSTIVDPDRVCTFKSGLTEVKVFLAPQAPDAATADKYYDLARTQLPAAVAVTDLNNLFDRAGYGDGTSQGAPVSALFVVKGTYGFDLFCGFPACSVAASVTAAQLVAGRLP